MRNEDKQNRRDQEPIEFRELIKVAPATKVDSLGK